MGKKLFCKALFLIFSKKPQQQQQQLIMGLENFSILPEDKAYIG